MTELPDSTDRQAVVKRALLELREMRAKLAALERARTEPIAVVGIGCRFPQAPTPDAFWELLRDGADATREVPADRWDADAYYDPRPGTPGKMYVRSGGFIDNVDRFDARFFNISPREATSMDPQHRLLLEVSWEALEHAGIAPHSLSGTKSGVFIGITTTDYSTLQGMAADIGQIDAYAATGNPLNFAAGRISYLLGLQGPSMAIDTACSSSLVAIHLACQSLRAGESDLAIAGGVSLILSPGTNVILCTTGLLAPDGRCKTFDASANGYGRGEGCGVVILKRLSDALAQGDRILGLVRGSAVNQDGPSSGLTVPNKQAQHAVICEALARAGVAPAQIGYVEAHGTGTALGDPIEVRALASALGEGRAPDRPLLIGSVKTNIGHLEAAAGIAGFIKVLLALQHKEIPRHLHFRTPNPHIAWSEIPIAVATQRTAWLAEQGTRIAGVSSFGASGTNAHVVLEEPPAVESQAEAGERPLHVLALSARGAQALQELARRFEQHLAAQPGQSFADLCYTTHVGRAHFDHRLALVASTAEDACEKLNAYLAGRLPSGAHHQPGTRSGSPKIAFLFTGQGSQYLDMGRQLYETEPTFRGALDQCAELLVPQLGLDLREVLYEGSGIGDQGSGIDARPPSPDPRSLDQTWLTQPALFALEYALAELWRSWGIVPAAVLGHSVGEYVAACVAGIFSLEDGLKLIAARGRLMQDLPHDGEMVAVAAGEEAVARAIAPYVETVSIAALNGPAETIVSGARGDVRALCQELEAQGIRTEQLNVSHAFHSPLMNPILPAFDRVASRVAYAPPRIKLISNLTGGPAAQIAQADYWRRHIRETVRFADGIKALYDQGIEIFLEIGPNRTLLGMGRRCLPKHAGMWLPSLRQGHSDWQQLLSSLGALYVQGVQIDWRGVDRNQGRRKVAAPSYPFQRERYWFTAARQAPQRSNAQAQPAELDAAEHPLLGRRLRSALEHIQYEARLSAASGPAILADHRVYGATIVSGVVHVAMALAAAAESIQIERAPVIEDVSYSQPLLLSDHEPTTVQLVLTPKNNGAALFRLYSLEQHVAWKEHTSGWLRYHPTASEAPRERISLQTIRERCGETWAGARFYQELWSSDEHSIGPSLQLVEQLWRRDGEALAQLRPAERPVFAPQPTTYRLDPAELLAQATVSENAGQVLLAALPGYTTLGGDGVSYIGIGVKRIVPIQGSLSDARWCHARLRQADSDQELLLGDISLLDASGEPIATIEGMQCRRVSRALIASVLQGSRQRRQRPQAALSRQTLGGAAAGERRALLEGYLRALVAAVSAIPEQQLDLSTPLRALGMDSLMAAELKAWIDEDLQVNLPVAELLKDPTIGQLAEGLLGSQALGAPQISPEGQAPATNGAWRPLSTHIPPGGDRWIEALGSSSEARIRLFCLPYGGGGASIFRQWGQGLPAAIEVCPIQLPGRENRIGEPAFEDVTSLVDRLASAIRPWLDRPFAIFGHSMGGLLGFELARQIRRQYALSVAHLFISAFPAAHLPNGIQSATSADAARIDLAFLERYGLLPPALLSNRELVEAILPTIRADLSMVERYDYRWEEPLRCPITTFGGEDDRQVGRDELAAWYRHTTGTFAIHMLHGAHLFVDHARPDILGVIARALLP